MPPFIKHTILQNNFILNSNRTIFWEEEKILILSDLHLGKTGHFRKSGIGVPSAIMIEDMQRLVAGIQFYKPLQIIIVGDLFHSVANKEHELFLKWRNDLKHITFLLVKGNHDIVSDDWYQKANIKTVVGIYTKNNFSFVHQIEDALTDLKESENYFFCGHIHPAIIIKGLGKQSLRFSCFYFTKNYAVLPAFGKFTGTYLIEPQKKEIAFAIVEANVIKCV